MKAYSVMQFLGLSAVMPKGQVTACIVLGVFCALGAVVLAYMFVKKRRENIAAAQAEPVVSPKELARKEAEAAARAAHEKEVGTRIIVDEQATVTPDGAILAVRDRDEKKKKEEAKPKERKPVYNYSAEEEEAALLAAAAIANDDSDEVFRGIEKGTGLAILVRYRKSFLARIIQSDEQTKSFYNDLKREILSYKDVVGRISWTADTFHTGRNNLFKFQIRGKTLCLYIALSPEDYADSKYKVENAGKDKYADVPCLYKIKNNKRAKYALDLIAAVAEKFGLERGETPTEDFRLEHRSTDELVEEGLIKELVSKEVYERYLERLRGSSIDSKKREFISASEVDSVLTDEAAIKFITKRQNWNKSGGKQKDIINIDTISANYTAGQIVTIDNLKEKGLLAAKTTYIKVLARGVLDKPITVEANDFSLAAVKMLVLTGGKAIKIIG